MSPETQNILSAIVTEVVQSSEIRNSEDVWADAFAAVKARLFAPGLLTDLIDDIDEALQEALSDNDFVICEVTDRYCHIDDVVSARTGTGRRSNELMVSSSVTTFDCDDCERTFISDYQSAASNRSATRGHATSEYTVDHNRTVCQHCYEDSYFSCDDCGEAYGCDDINSCDDGTYCNGCAPCGMPTNVNNRCVLPRQASSSQDGLAVGWEIEFYPADGVEVTSKHNQHVERILHDGSLSSEGREITTQPALPDEWATRLNGIKDLLNDGDVKSDCGGHIHVDARHLHSLLWDGFKDISALKSDRASLKDALENVRSMMNLDEDLVSALLGKIDTLDEKISKSENGPKRGTELIHGILVNYQNTLRLLCSEKRNKSQYAHPQTALNINYEKYTAVNITGLHHNAGRKTIEFRLWDGSIDATTLIRRAEVCEAMVRKLTEIAELAQGDDLQRQKATQYIDSKMASDLQTSRGFEDIYGNGAFSYDVIKRLADELGLSSEWIKWAKGIIAERCPAIADAA